MTKHILKNDGKTLGNLLQKISRLEEFNQVFAQYVTPSIVSHCQVTNLQNNCLIVLVDSASWATQLRFYIPSLLPKLRQHPPLKEIKSICCKVRPASTPAHQMRKTLPKPAPLSKKTVEAILESANKIQDEKIRKILEKIARRNETL